MSRLRHAVVLCLFLLAGATAKEKMLPQITIKIPGKPVVVKVGPVKLTDGDTYVMNVPVSTIAGAGDASVGTELHMTVTVAPDGCTGNTTITTNVKAKAILPGPFMQAANIITTFVPPLKVLTDFVTDFIELQQQEIVVAANGEIEDLVYTLKDLSPPKIPLKPIFDFLGMDIKFIIGLSKMTQFKQGLEVPLDLSVDILKKKAVKLPAKVCGARKDKPCGPEKCKGLAIKCRACQGFCFALGQAIDIANGKPMANLPAAISITGSQGLLGMIKTNMPPGVSIPEGIIVPCSHDPSKDCLAIGDRKTKCDGTAGVSVTTAGDADLNPLPGDDDPIPGDNLFRAASSAAPIVQSTQRTEKSIQHVESQITQLIAAQKTEESIHHVEKQNEKTEQAINKVEQKEEEILNAVKEMKNALKKNKQTRKKAHLRHETEEEIVEDPSDRRADD